MKYVFFFIFINRYASKKLIKINYVRCEIASLGLKAQTKIEEVQAW